MITLCACKNWRSILSTFSLSPGPTVQQVCGIDINRAAIEFILRVNGLYVDGTNNQYRNYERALIWPSNLNSYPSSSVPHIILSNTVPIWVAVGELAHKSWYFNADNSGTSITDVEITVIQYFDEVK